VAIDINQTRLDFAKSNGFAEDVHCLPVGERAKTAEEGLKQAKEKITAALSQFGEEEGFDLIFECTGAEPCIQMSVHVRFFVFAALLVSNSVFPLQAAITGGKVMLVGMGSRNVLLPLSTAAVREVDIHGSFRYANTYPTAIELLSSGKLENIEKLISHRMPLEDTAKAFNLLSRGKDDSGNMVLKIIVGS